MDLKTILAGGGVVLLLSLIEISPLKLNPWVWLGERLASAIRALGRMINAEVLVELREVKAAQKAQGIKLDDHIRLDELGRIARDRERILAFSDELGLGTRHSEEMFNEVLDAIDRYENFCDAHPDYPNSKAVAAIKHIRDNYAVRITKHDFLQGGKSND